MGGCTKPKQGVLWAHKEKYYQRGREGEEI